MVLGVGHLATKQPNVRPFAYFCRLRQRTFHGKVLSDKNLHKHNTA